MGKLISFGAGVVAIFILGIWAAAGVTTVAPGEVGIVVKNIGENRGMQKETLDVGWRWVEPFTYDVINYDVKFRQYDEGLKGIPSQTKDGQPISVDLSLEVGLDREKVPFLHNTVGKSYYSQVVLPAARSVARNSTTLMASDEIYTGTGRSEVQRHVQEELAKRMESRGINIVVNLRNIHFTNDDFIRALEAKAKAAQNVIIEQRNAEAAAQQAVRTINIAEGAKQQRIKQAEAEREELRLKGEGQRLKKEEEAKGILAVAKAEAEGTRLQVLAYGNGATYASVKWAENLGPNVKVYGVPTGSPGTTSFVDINSVFKGAFKGAE